MKFIKIVSGETIYNTAVPSKTAVSAKLLNWENGP